MRAAARTLPALFVTFLLAVALLAPGRRARAADPRTGLDALSYPVCSPVQVLGADDAQWMLPITNGNGIVQPLGALGNLASVILDVDASAFVGKELKLVSWNSASLLPEPGTVALRTVSFNATVFAHNASRLDFTPPVVTRSLPGVAEPPTLETAIEYRVSSSFGYSEMSYFDPDGPAEIPAGMGVRGSTYLPLGGPHPVFRHAVCGGDGLLQSHHVAQSVMKSDASIPWHHAQFIQKFRVPSAVQLAWVELAFKGMTTPGWWDYAPLLIVDAEGQTVPPATFDAPLASALFFTPGSGGPRWISHQDFTTAPHLQPNHDYWLVITPEGDFDFGARFLTGQESPYFQNGVGGFFTRPTLESEAVPMTDRVLNFQIIGIPLGSVGVEEEMRRPSIFALSVAPNPVRGSAFITWSGARGDLRFEVLDARGRRVSSGAAGIGESGRWTWSGTGDDGRALPAGVYFVRARDGVGRNASTRVTLVR